MTEQTIVNPTPAQVEEFFTSSNTGPKVYLAGPMRGIAEFNFPAFDAAAAYLEGWGYQVFSPASIDRERGFNPTGMTGHEDLSEHGFSLAEALKADLSVIADRCEAIFLLPGWEKSSGACAELALAAALGLPAALVEDADIPPHAPAAKFLNAITTTGGEVRVTSETGGQKGSKPARFDLIPAGPLWATASLYGRGAEKYTRYGECACALSVPNKSTHSVYVDPITNVTYGSVTQNMPSASASTLVSGQETTRSTKEPTTRSTLGHTTQANTPEPMDSPLSNTAPTWISPAESVEPSQSTLTTTMPAVNEDALSASVVGSVTAVTLASDTLKDGMSSTARQHEPGCPALVPTQTGDRNWERGYDWSLSFAALQRHAWSFWNGQDDDEETGLPHLASVVFHAFALMEYRETHPEFDNRPRA